MDNRRSIPARILAILTRKKIVKDESVAETNLSRCLTLLDLTALGIGSTLGAGIYVIAGQVAKDTAGPAVVISFFIAAFAAILSGLCYAEFGARVPKAGSAYIYSYVTVGELWAFIIGWNLILEYIIGTASVARAWSAYLDSFLNNTMAHHFREAMPMDIEMLSKYPDFVAFSLCIVLSIILAAGVQEASKFNLVFTGLNLVVVIYAVIVGSFKADLKNWHINSSVFHNTTIYGSGGFAPFGFKGILAGAATCFYAFVGFDAIATAGEEAKNPRKDIPLSIIGSLLACCVAYLVTSIIVTLLVPYYLLDQNAPLPIAFGHVGYNVAQYVIAGGAICGLTTSLLGSIFPVPRVIYSMASDGLIFRFFAVVNKRFKTPARATLSAGFLAAVLALVFDLQALVDMMSIGTLLAYTLVAASVLMLRYKEGENSNIKVTIGVTFIAISSTSISLLVTYLSRQLSEHYWWTYLILGIAGGVIFSSTVIIYLQKQNNDEIYFKVPFLPVIPVLSIFINLFLMFKLHWQTWIRFGVWMFIGFVIYFSYGLRKSSANPPESIDIDDTDYPELLHDDNEKLIN